MQSYVHKVSKKTKLQTNCSSILLTESDGAKYELEFHAAKIQTSLLHNTTLSLFL